MLHQGKLATAVWYATEQAHLSEIGKPRVHTKNLFALLTVLDRNYWFLWLFVHIFFLFLQINIFVDMLLTVFGTRKHF